MVSAKTKPTLDRIINNYVNDVGKPACILAENGTRFTSTEWRRKLKSEDIEVKFCSVRDAQSNPTKRVMKKLGRMFEILCNHSHVSLAKYIPVIEDCSSTWGHFSTVKVPYVVQFGKQLIDGVNTRINYPDDCEIDLTHLLKQVKTNFINKFNKQKKNKRIIIHMNFLRVSWSC